MNWLPVALSLLVALAGSGGVLFGALRYNRDEAGKVVEQQTAVLGNMQHLIDELQDAVQRARDDAQRERDAKDALLNKLGECTKEMGELKTEMARLRTLMRKNGIHE